MVLLRQQQVNGTENKKIGGIQNDVDRGIVQRFN